MWARECVSVLVGWTAPQMSIASSWLMVLLSSIMSLLIFCRLDLGTSAKRGVDFSSEAVDSSVFPCSAISFCLVLWYSIVRHTHVKDYYIFLAHRLLYHYAMFLITLIIFFSLKSSFFEINISYFIFLLISVSMIMFSVNILINTDSYMIIPGVGFL